MSTEQRAQVQLDRAGTFRAYPLSWTVESSDKPDSQSVAIAIQFGIFQQWHPDENGNGGQWSQEWPQGYFVYGRSFVVGRDGKTKAGAVEALAKAALWNGDWDALAGTPPNVFVLIEVEPNEFGGKTTYRAAWINPNADVPKPRSGAFAPADESLLASLRARFGGETRAIAGGKPAGHAPAPPAPGGATRPAAPSATPQRPVAPAGPAPATPATPAPAATPQRPPTPPRTPPVPGSGQGGVPPSEGAPSQPPGPPPAQSFGDAAEPTSGDGPPF